MLLAGRLGLADDSPAAVTPEAGRDQAQQAAAIERALDIIDLVLEHHIDSPTRQELLRQIAINMDPRVPKSTQANESLALQCTNRDESRQFLMQLRTELAPVMAALKEEETQASKSSAPLVQKTPQRRNLPAVSRRSPSFDDSLQGAISRIVPGGVRLIPARERKVQEQFQANRYVGIGVALGSGTQDYQGFSRLIPNGPAVKAGVIEGDLIESIDDKSMKGSNVTEVVDRIRGPEGTKVTLVVRQPDAATSRTLTITRSVIPRDTVHAWSQDFGRPRYRVDPDRPIACIRISEIGGSTVHELRQMEQQLTADGIKAVVLDLRNSIQGAPHFAVLLADALLEGGVIGRIRTKSRVQEFVADRECLFRGLPLAVLVDQNTSNTGEWLAAALQDNHRAVIVGHATRGDTSAYSSIPFPGGDDVVLLATGVLQRPSATPNGPSASAEQRKGSLMRSPAAWKVHPDYESGAGDVAATRACELLQAKLDAPLK
jgi:C-terminal peptidase prc